MGGVTELSFQVFLARQRLRVQRRLTKTERQRLPQLLQRCDQLKVLVVQTRGSCGSLGQKRKDLSALDGTYDG